ncbi:AAA family ATPase [Vibrio cyclitrophicus]|uniref:AAA family ATPase n=1 Tax=Vibrio cyclitrophicus TaxID=47951 RepID=UPI0007EEC4EA|nr:AAA family ATPase [Vibrio cyclitrophicus]OBT02695.1 AAA family ATPase [Vibrio cyclitrophicus]
MIEKIYAKIEEQYFSSGDFNGLPVHKLLYDLNVPMGELRAIIRHGIDSNVLTVEMLGNTHIKSFSSVPKVKVLEHYDTEDFPSNMCLYPHPDRLKTTRKLSEYSDTPYQLELAKGSGQLDYVTFDLSVLEFYRNDPRYTYDTDFIHGYICITDEHFQSKLVPEKDQVILKSFGFAYDDDFNRYVAVFIRYLASLSPEHQQIWRAKEVIGDIKLHPDYFNSSINGSWGTRLSIFEAFVQELDIINKMAALMDKPPLFHNSFYQDRPKDFGFLLRPTISEFNSFMHLLDKIMSDNINKKFFEDDVNVETEEERADGKVIVRNKGTIQILSDWIDKYYQIPDRKPVDDMLAAFRKVRKLRQKPAHKVNADAFDQSLFKEQREIVIKAYDAVRTLRLMLSNHPMVRTNPPKISERLYKGEIWDI